jgi:glycosyltransferase involved in cell wall biosynthesis
VTVVVPVRNGATTSADQFAALAAQRYEAPWEVVVADNGSTDATRAVVAEWGPRLPGLRVVDAVGPTCAAAARNAGVAESRGDFLAFCDADDVVGPEWLASLASAASEFDIVTGPLDADQLNSEDVSVSRPLRADGIPRSNRFLPFAPSGNVGVWRDVFTSTGGFDDAYAQCEDVEWSWRAQLRAGSTIGFAPGAVVHYRYRVGTRAIARQAFDRGRFSARLYRDYRRQGLPRASTKRGLYTWAWVVFRSPTMIAEPGRATWVRRAAESAGRLYGSLRFRVLFL